MRHLARFFTVPIARQEQRHAVEGQQAEAALAFARRRHAHLEEVRPPRVRQVQHLRLPRAHAERLGPLLPVRQVAPRLGIVLEEEQPRWVAARLPSSTPGAAAPAALRLLLGAPGQHVKGPTEARPALLLAANAVPVQPRGVVLAQREGVDGQLGPRQPREDAPAALRGGRRGGVEPQPVDRQARRLVAALLRWRWSWTYACRVSAFN